MLKMQRNWLQPQPKMQIPLQTGSYAMKNAGSGLRGLASRIKNYLVYLMDGMGITIIKIQMLKLSQTILKCRFAIVPERASRYFNLTLQTHLDSPLSDLMQEEHKRHIQAYEQKGALLMAFQDKTQNKEPLKFIYLFQSPNQLEPHQFMKQVPFKDHLKDYEIEELEMEPRVRNKQLAPKHLRQ